MKKKGISILLILLIMIVSFGAIAHWTNSGEKEPKGSKTRIDAAIMKQLVDADPVHKIPSGSVLYILGGSEDSLLLKFKVASILYRQGKCKRILVLHRKGRTEFNRSLGRNLTNDEWASIELEKLGIPRQMVEMVKIEEGFFGTFAEARGISSLAKKRRYKCIVLVTAAPHTHRARISFENFLKDSHISIYAVASDEEGLFTEHLLEYVKLKVYELLLLKSSERLGSGNAALVTSSYS